MKNKSTIKEVMSDMIISDEMMEQLVEENEQYSPYHIDKDEFKIVTFDHIGLAEEKRKQKIRFFKFKKIIIRFFKPKEIKIVVAGCNSGGAVITSNHILDLTLYKDDYLYFNRKILRSKFLKEVKMIDNSIPMYRFNIRVYDRHELNIDKTLSNYDDLFVAWYNTLCLEANEPAIDLEAVSDLATKLIDDEWCKPLY